jgi:hypothetical protein
MARRTLINLSPGCGSCSSQSALGCDALLRLAAARNAAAQRQAERTIDALEAQILVLTLMALQQPLGSLGPSTVTGSWPAVVTPNPLNFAHTISVGAPVDATFERTGNSVSVAVVYFIDIGSTDSLSMLLADFISLPFPPSPPFASETDATGTAASTALEPGDTGGPGRLLTEVGGARLNATYPFLSAGSSFVAQIVVRATYSIV